MKSGNKWLISFLHAFVLLLLTAWWINSDYTYGDERMLIQQASIFKRVVLGLDEDPPKKDFLFINLAHDKALIPIADGLGNDVITDREKLASFFEIFKRHQKEIRFGLCDVFLKGHSDYDVQLERSVAGIHNIIFPTHYDENGKVEPLSLRVPHAMADYRMANSGFFKFKLFQNDSIPSIPVYLYQQLTGNHFTWLYGWPMDNGRLTMNSMIIDYPIRSYELFQQAEYPVVNLSELMILPEQTIVNEFLKNRIVLLGDFENDVHDTIYGKTPGTLILLNVYLTMMSGRHLVSLWWLLFLIGGYTIFSRLMLFPQYGKAKHMRWFAPLLASATFLAFLSVISYLMFHQPVQVLVLTIYINFLRFLIQLRQQEWNRHKLKEYLINLRETYLNFK
ncbi:CHASE2 domain-containing protein [Mucilaginibacter sp. L3T2-6]|uniref:CHASE2 domain-containing protein n=1 Tax=Mucilaginibacter sp. L3T2-6 TaxID=3062491 RepID=UPI002675D97F|nr:CHASE2 domain-containing protein [Mucilaginibacter sp. L3T2-6]MDO3644467.1 CHASE2 domain-containing protein [Mucilaginibacter sp. L3T2-6]MDV6216919.1 CHASE2 domain-containing protein [Mucilaginibacter sp. L3T2-6]